MNWLSSILDSFSKRQKFIPSVLSAVGTLKVACARARALDRKSRSEEMSAVADTAIKLKGAFPEASLSDVVEMARPNSMSLAQMGSDQQSGEGFAAAFPFTSARKI